MAYLIDSDLVIDHLADDLNPENARATLVARLGSWAAFEFEATIHEICAAREAGARLSP